MMAEERETLRKESFKAGIVQEDETGKRVALRHGIRKQKRGEKLARMRGRPLQAGTSSDPASSSPAQSMPELLERYRTRGPSAELLDAMYAAVSAQHGVATSALESAGVLPELLRRHAELDVETLYALACLLSCVSYYANRQLVAAPGAVGHLAQFVSDGAHDARVRCTFAMVLANLCSAPGGATAVISAGGVVAIADAVRASLDGDHVDLYDASWALGVCLRAATPLSQHPPDAIVPAYAAAIGVISHQNNKWDPEIEAGLLANATGVLFCLAQLPLVIHRHLGPQRQRAVPRLLELAGSADPTLVSNVLGVVSAIAAYPESDETLHQWGVVARLVGVLRRFFGRHTGICLEALFILSNLLLTWTGCLELNKGPGLAELIRCATEHTDGGVREEALCALRSLVSTARQQKSWISGGIARDLFTEGVARAAAEFLEFDRNVHRPAGVSHALYILLQLLQAGPELRTRTRSVILAQDPHLHRLTNVSGIAALQSTASTILDTYFVEEEDDVLTTQGDFTTTSGEGGGTKQMFEF